MKIISATFAVLFLSQISSSTANRLILSNQKDTGRLGCIKCYEDFAPRIATCVAPGKNTSIELPNNATTEAWCVGTYDNESRGYRTETLYYAYDSSKDFEKFRDKIIVKVNDTGFYRSNGTRKEWELIFPKIWRLP
ncbi:hypothetical protein AB3S75_041624 [Citrus x aurantiifolia]